MKGRYPTGCDGVTLIELVIVLAILAIVMALAGPGLRAMMLNNRMTSQANEVGGMIQFARSEAARLSRPVRLRPLPTSPTSGNEWGEGWVIEAPLSDPDKQLDTTLSVAWDVLRQFRPLADGSTLVNPSGVTLFTFMPAGRFAMDGDSNLYPEGTGTKKPRFELCDSRSDEVGRIIVLSYIGQPSVEKPPLDSKGVPVVATDPC